MPESASSPNVTWPWSSNAAAYNRVAHAAGAGGVVCGLTSVGGDDQDQAAPDPGRGAGAAGGGHVPRVVVPRRPGEAAARGEAGRPRPGALPQGSQEGSDCAVVVAVGRLDHPGDPGPGRPRGAGTGCRAGHARRGDRQAVGATSMARSAASARTARSYWSWVARV